jgi:F-type H+-transporting ATPase subunit b
MPIDWFTVTAQALNFVVLVWLLKRFLYGPILQAIDAREKRVADELADAAAKQAQALRERDDFARRNAEFDQQREARLARVQVQAGEEHRQLLDKARADAVAWSTRRLASLRAEARQQGQVIRVQVQQEVIAIVRKTLHDLASEGLEQRVCAVLAERLRGMDAAQRDGVVTALDAGGAPVQVHSAFPLSQPQRDVVEAALRAVLTRDVPVQYSCDPGLVCGIELIGNGYKVGWNINDYLDAMERQVAQHLRQLTESAEAAAPARPAPEAEASPESSVSEPPAAAAPFAGASARSVTSSR